MENKNEMELLPVVGDTVTGDASIFANINNYRDGWKMAASLAQSDLVPKEFRGKVENSIIALEMSQRMGASPLAVMQSIYIVHGKPSWSASFIIAALNASRRFSPIRFDVTGEGDERNCVAWAYDLRDNEKLTGPAVSIEMAKKEGWYGKNGSKWQTMPELMLRYRAATFFGRLYAPDILMGMQTAEEVRDIGEGGDRTKPKIEMINTVTGEVSTSAESASKVTPPTPGDEKQTTGGTKDTGQEESAPLKEELKRVECPDDVGFNPLVSYCDEECKSRPGCPAHDDPAGKLHINI